MTTKLGMETTASQDQQQQPPTEHAVAPPLLRCPRCDSSNTKFCYYNNYSLSQPRHFCKACKRYWTRGGTLRNVPVGGGCRKNKRLKRHHESLEPPGGKDKTNIITTCTTSTTNSVTSSTAMASINKSSSSSIFNQFAGLSSFAPASAATARAAPAGLEGLNTSSSGAGVDLPPMLNSLWFNYPASATATSHHLDYGSQNPNSNIQELLPTDHYPLLSSPPSSLLATTLQQQKMVMSMRDNRAVNDFQVFFPAVLDLHQSGNTNHGSSSLFKGFKMDVQEGYNHSVPCITNTNGLPLPTSDHHLSTNSYWNAGGVAGANYWPEVTNFGPSITPLI